MPARRAPAPHPPIPPWLLRLAVYGLILRLGVYVRADVSLDLVGGTTGLDSGGGPGAFFTLFPFR